MSEESIFFLWSVVVTAAVGTCSATSIYFAWTALVEPLNQEFGNNYIGRYSVAVCILTSSLTNYFAAPRIDAIGPRKMAQLGGTAVSLGFILGGLGIQMKQEWMIFAFTGVMGGAGAGIAFLAGLLACIKWFAKIKKKPGLGAGVYGVAIGLMAMLYNEIDLILCANMSLSHVFYVLGGINFLLHLPPIIYLSFPTLPPAAKPSEKPFSVLQILQTTEFWTFFALLLFVLTPGTGPKFLITSMVEKTYGVDPSAAGHIGTIFWGAYTVGRLLLSSAADFVPVARLYTLFALGNLILFSTLPTVVARETSDTIFASMLCLAGFLYAGAQILMGVTLMKLWGPLNLSKVTGMTLVAYGSANALGPVLAGASKSSYLLYYKWMAGSSAAALIISFFLKPVNYDKYFRLKEDDPSVQAVADENGSTVFVEMRN